MFQIFGRVKLGPQVRGCTPHRTAPDRTVRSTPQGTHREEEKYVNAPVPAALEPLRLPGGGRSSVSLPFPLRSVCSDPLSPSNSSYRF
mmetsp:Transcript_41672/g.97546  ORF Transcript_41672/g.97546 Transcript_41672/m.97546 type:complete len:88 (-) Transcript_41672:65-328(-)